MAKKKIVKKSGPPDGSGIESIIVDADPHREQFSGTFQAIEWQAIVDALVYVQRETLVSDAHVRALKKLRAWHVGLT